MSRRGYVIVTAAAVLTIVGVSAVQVAPKLIWNASASTPIGFYLIRPTERIAVTNLVALEAPEPLAAFLEQRGYLARGVPLLKRVVALPGQRVCRIGRTVTVDGLPMAAALERDRFGRELPVWRGCRRIADGEVFLMNAQVRDSLDGRYFGPLPAAAIIGRATPLYTDEDGDGRFVWRAPTR
ncbi:S26 family signal peptidase [Sphingomonas ursincola]|uniref:S26 family signal peptidase n=1 Tax=Sphingomonas ursincola TaxID=56361 RepID=A0A7V8U9M2_9SPHN|nr:S26 family signal peptidase [Sphingomonas ursincola]MBA1375921.1 S26 family signal peptidase [Sphingomonas ursincola]